MEADAFAKYEAQARKLRMVNGACGPSPSVREPTEPISTEKWNEHWV